MNFNGLFELFFQDPDYRVLAKDHASNSKKTINKLSVIESARPFLISSLNYEYKTPIIIIVSSAEKARHMYEQIRVWTGKEKPVELFPEPELLPYQRALIDNNTELDSARILTNILNDQLSNRQVIVASVNSIVKKLPDPTLFLQTRLFITEGLNKSPSDIADSLDKLGYISDYLVDKSGTFSRRGGIIDVFPITEKAPVRIEFFGNSIDSLRFFDTVTQRSFKHSVESICIHPATLILEPKNVPDINLANLNDEFNTELAEELDGLKNGFRPCMPDYWAPYFNNNSIIDYLPKNTLVLMDEPESIDQAAEFHHIEAESFRKIKIAAGELPSKYPTPYLNWNILKMNLREFQKIELSSWGLDRDQVKQFPFTTTSNYTGSLPKFIEDVGDLSSKGNRVLVFSYQSDRLAEFLRERNISFSRVDNIETIPLSGSITLIHSLISNGWIFKNTTYLFTDKELFGFSKKQRKPIIQRNSSKLSLPELRSGDYVVHIDHGIALFVDVITMEVSKIKKEYILLEYSKGDRLYVPTDQISRISRYIGANDDNPNLNNLGSREWSLAKENAKKAAVETAQELIELYATRQTVPGYAFSTDTLWQQELEGSFPYVETPDQALAISEIKHDMEKAQPMDRLILGDVGYGKTEVALRAAFKAVMDGKQVAILVPTTILAQQHYSTFKKRLAAFPIEVEVISRFRNHNEQQNILKALKTNSIDIIIGTHRLIQKDVKFLNLGLLIIDEEQRFGVMHKELIKNMSKNIDVLTLSATPIPRTLYFSLTGVRDMSVISTPPGERLPIKTFVTAYNEQLIREAILREFERDGQVYFVHNQVRSIKSIAEKLQNLVPEASFIVAHGQMPEEELENAMADFTEGKIVVLVCTTIIESGLDVPNANTLIVNDADRFGLTQLYQLRGRVGRGVNLAYAYFIYEKSKQLTRDAEQRLRTIFEAGELGAGYEIAMRDLEIRGAGTLLGTKQSGHITAVGFNLYSSLLREAVSDLKSRKGSYQSDRDYTTTGDHIPIIDLPLSAFVPDTFISSINARIDLYRRLNNLQEKQELNDMELEIKDRFGIFPVEVSNLLYIIRLKLLCKSTEIHRIILQENQIVISFNKENRSIDINAILSADRTVRASNNKIWIPYTESDFTWTDKLEKIIWKLAKNGSN